MSDLTTQIEALFTSPPSDPAARSNLYHAARKPAAATEDPPNTLCRVNRAPIILTFAQVAYNLGLFKKLVETWLEIWMPEVMILTEANSGRILRFLASMDMIAEAGEDEFTLTLLIHSPVPASRLLYGRHAMPSGHTQVSCANARSTVQDMTMMTSLAPAERTERQWNALLDQAGLKVKQRTTYKPETGESIIATVPK